MGPESGKLPFPIMKWMDGSNIKRSRESQSFVSVILSNRPPPPQNVFYTLLSSLLPAVLPILEIPVPPGTVP